MALNIDPKQKKCLDDDLVVQVPDLKSRLKSLQKLAERRNSEQAQRAEHLARARQRVSELQVAENAAVHEGAALEGHLEALGEQLDLASTSAELLGGEQQVLFPAQPEEPPLHLDDGFVSETLKSLTELDLGTVAAELFEHALDRSDVNGDSGFPPESFMAVAFKQAVLSGFVASRALQDGAASAQTIASLFSLLAYSSDDALSGAAYHTLMTLLGDAAGQHGVAVDAAASLHPSSFISFEYDRAEGEMGAPVAPSYVELERSPTASQILEAIRKNGFDPIRAAEESKTKASSDGKRHHEHGNPPGARENNEGCKIEEEVVPLRVYAVKLLLRLTGALCRYVAGHPGAYSKDFGSSDTMCELILAVTQLGLDAAYLHLQPELEAAAVALLDAIDDEGEWRSRLLPLAESVAQVGSSAAARLRVLQNIPVGTKRGMKLRELAGCFVLCASHCVGAGHANAKASRKRHVIEEESDAPANIVTQQWFVDPKALVNDAVGMVAAAKSNGKQYSYADVEMLLRTCNLLLWSHALKNIATSHRRESQQQVQEAAEGIALASSGNDDGYASLSPLKGKFLESWMKFLKIIQRSIKSMQTEQQAVRCLASHYECQYRDVVGER